MANKVTALRHNKIVHVIIDENMYAKEFKSNADATGFYKRAETIAHNPTEVNVASLMTDLDLGLHLTMEDLLIRKSGSFYLKGYESAPIPEELLSRMKTELDSGRSISPLVNFFKLLLLNPDTHVRKDLFKFMNHYDFPITDNGYFIGYRACKQTNSTYSAVTNFVPKEYLMLKAEGANPADYTAVKDPDGGNLKAVLTDVLTDDNGKFIAPDNVLGNLQDMFEEQNNGLVEAPEFTDFFSGTTHVRLGGTVSMDRSQCDNNPKNACSRGLHIGTPDYVKRFGGDDAAYIACLVNPMNVVAVPGDYRYMKMRVCEYYAYGMLDMANNLEIRTPYFEIDYKTWEERELEKMLKDLTHIVEGEDVNIGIRQIISERLQIVA
jgi:hypothetical protein